MRDKNKHEEEEEPEEVATCVRKCEKKHQCAWSGGTRRNKEVERKKKRISKGRRRSGAHERGNDSYGQVIVPIYIK